MPKLVYWIAPYLDDQKAYNIRAKTKKACEAQVKKESVGLSAPIYGPVVKNVIKYKDAFDLMEQCSSWE